jgi:hypothetical protein
MEIFEKRGRYGEKTAGAFHGFYQIENQGGFLFQQPVLERRQIDSDRRVLNRVPELFKRAVYAFRFNQDILFILGRVLGHKAVQYQDFAGSSGAVHGLEILLEALSIIRRRSSLKIMPLFLQIMGRSE